MPTVGPFENFYYDWDSDITVSFCDCIFLQSTISVIQDFYAKLSQCHITVTTFNQTCFLDQMQHPGIFLVQNLWSRYYSYPLHYR